MTGFIQSSHDGHVVYIRADTITYITSDPTGTGSLILLDGKSVLVVDSTPGDLLLDVMQTTGLLPR